MFLSAEHNDEGKKQYDKAKFDTDMFYIIAIPDYGK